MDDRLDFWFIVLKATKMQMALKEEKRWNYLINIEL